MGTHDTSSARFRRRAAVAVGLALLAALGAVGTAHAAGPAKVKGTPCTVGVRACVDLGEKEAWLISPEGKIKKGPVDISPGAKGTPTPRGDFTVERKVKNYWSREYDAAMPNSVFFNVARGIAFHEGNLGRRSAGCIRLGEDDSETFFTYLQIGDRVQIR